MRFSRATAVCLLLLLSRVPAKAQTSDAEAALARALKLSDLYNWADAEPFFATAERLYLEREDSRNALYARLGRVRSTMEQLSLPETSAMLERELDDNPLLQSDKQLRLFCLVVKGDIDGELDSGPMKRDWEEVLETAKAVGDRKWQNRAAGELGFAAFLDGDVGNAQRMVATALLAAVATGDIGAQIRYLAAIGTGLALTGSPEQGLGYLDRAAKLAEQTPDAGAQFLISTGRLTAFRDLGRLDEAERLAEALIAEARAKQKRVKEAQVLISASGISRARKNYARAIQELGSAVDLAETGQFSRLLADAQFQLASAYTAAGDLTKAEEVAASAVAAAQAGGEIYELPKRLQYLAQLQTRLGRYSAADETYDRAADVVEMMVANVSKVATKGALITALGEIFTEQFSLIADHLNDVVKAYEVLEKARGRATTDLLRTGEDASLGHERQVDRQISELRLKLVKAKSAASIRQIRDEMFLAEQRRWAGPSSNRLASGSGETIALDQLRKALRPDELLLEYVLHEPSSYCLVVSKENARIVRLSNRKEIEELVSRYLASVRSKEAALGLGKQLFQMLLSPIQEHKQKSRLKIVRDGQLHRVPFDALTNAAGRYVVSTHFVSYAPSAGAWYLLQTMPAQQTAGRSFLGVGGVPYDSNLGKIAVTRGYGAEGFGNLPGSKDEVVAAAEVLRSANNTLLMGAEATEKAFKDARLSDRAVIHLAVHGIENQLRPEQAALLLLSDAGSGEDGILQASEIVQLRTNADLIVLSACDTAQGRLQGAEGIANLARAFLLSGTRSVVATLWAVDDTWSLSLMKQFYKNLVNGRSVTEALTTAKREIIRLYGPRAIPYYWAGFTVEGAGESNVAANALRR
jgi:CHAT domain-containing protein